MEKVVTDFVERTGIYAITFDQRKLKLLHSRIRSFQISLSSDIEILQKVEALSSQFAIVGSYPVGDYANAIASKINGTYNPNLGNADALKYFSDKAHLYYILSCSSVRIPKDIKATQISDERNVIIKPRFGENSVGVMEMTRQNPEVNQYLQDQNSIVQEKVYGDLLNCDVLVVNGKSRLISINKRVPLPQNSHLTGLTIQSGQSACCNPDRYIDIANVIAERLGYFNGPMTIDLIEAADNSLYFLEASPFFHKPWLTWLYNKYSGLVAVGAVYSVLTSVTERRDSNGNQCALEMLEYSGYPNCVTSFSNKIQSWLVNSSIEEMVPNKVGGMLKRRLFGVCNEEQVDQIISAYRESSRY